MTNPDLGAGICGVVSNVQTVVPGQGQFGPYTRQNFSVNVSSPVVMGFVNAVIFGNETHRAPDMNAYNDKTVTFKPGEKPQSLLWTIYKNEGQLKMSSGVQIFDGNVVGGGVTTPSQGTQAAPVQNPPPQTNAAPPAPPKIPEDALGSAILYDKCFEIAKALVAKHIPNSGLTAAGMTTGDAAKTIAGLVQVIATSLNAHFRTHGVMPSDNEVEQCKALLHQVWDKGGEPPQQEPEYEGEGK